LLTKQIAKGMRMSLRMSLQNKKVVDAPTPPAKFHDSAATTGEADDAPTPPAKFHNSAAATGEAADTPTESDSCATAAASQTPSARGKAIAKTTSAFIDTTNPAATSRKTFIPKTVIAIILAAIAMTAALVGSFSLAALAIPLPITDSMPIPLAGEQTTSQLSESQIAETQTNAQGASIPDNNTQTPQPQTPQTNTINPQTSLVQNKPDAYGNTYTGSVIDGVYNGQGKLTYPDGSTYEGDMKDGLPNGQGIYIANNKDTYIGTFAAGVIKGQGTMTYADGSKYTGQWQAGTRHGQGTYTAADNSTYTGTWQTNTRHGQGTFTAADNSKYTGTWHKNLRHGQGTQTYTDKEGELFATYEGNFANDTRFGWGKLSYTTGEVLEGIWQGDSLQVAF
jgi:hypothetical protein